MVHVFISYARSDLAFVKDLIQHIESAGHEHWIDREQLKVSQDWTDEIFRAIDTAYALIVIKSPASQKSKYVTTEWSYALGAGIPIVSLLYKQQRTKNIFLEAINHLDFTNATLQPWDDLFAALDEKRSQHGIRVNIPKDASPKVKAGLKKLNSDFSTEVMDGVRLLSNLQDPITIDPLIIILDYEDDNVVHEATQALLKMGDIAIPKLVDDFVKEVQIDNRRYKIAIALALSKSDAALYGFLNALHDQRPRVRFLTANGLGNLMRIEGIAGLVGIRYDPDIVVRTEVIRALGDLGWVARDNVNNEALTTIIEALNDDAIDVRTFAARGIGIIGSISGVPALRNALFDTALPVRIAAAKSLGDIGDESAIDDLLSLSRDEDGTIRQAGLNALNFMRSRGSTKAYEAILRWPP